MHRSEHRGGRHSAASTADDHNKCLFTLIFSFIALIVPTLYTWVGSSLHYLLDLSSIFFFAWPFFMSTNPRCWTLLHTLTEITWHRILLCTAINPSHTHYTNIVYLLVYSSPTCILIDIFFTCFFFTSKLYCPQPGVSFSTRGFWREMLLAPTKLFVLHDFIVVLATSYLRSILHRRHHVKSWWGISKTHLLLCGSWFISHV